MNAAEFAVEEAMSTGHTFAADSPVTYPTTAGPAAGETFEALRFQIVEAITRDWPVREFPFDRMTCQLIQSFAYTQALSIWTRRHD